MAKTKISEFSTTAGNNTDINSINIAEGCAPSGINDAIRELMRQLKEFQTGGAGDSVNSGGDFSVATNKFTVASASGNTAVAGTLAVTGVATLTAQPILSSLTASKAVFTDASKGLVSNDVTGTGNVVMSNSPTLVTPALGTPASGVVTNLTGTASININGTVGATTPSTGAFTTLSSTGNTTLGDASGDTITVNGTTTFVNANPTLSAGTANGVIYLNGSKVATSGSALTFDGSKFTVSATSGETGLLTATGVSNYLSIKGDTGGTTLWAGFGTDTGLTWVGSVSNHPISFRQNNAEQMRLTSTGLGIGTSLPGYKLDVIGTIHAYNASNANALILENGTNNGVYARWKRPNREYYLALDINNNGGTDFSLYDATAGATRWTVDSSGNLGLGVTPSASWVAGAAALQQNLGSVHCNTSLGAYDVAYNSIRTASDSYVYAFTGLNATRLQQRDGTFRFFTAASGTAGDAITFTQAMTLDASGNLLVGTTSAIGRSGVSAQEAVVAAAGKDTSYILQASNSYFALASHVNTTSGTRYHIGFGDGTTWTERGTISTNGTSTTYSTSSDYRLKDNQQPLTGSGAFIDALKPKTWNWKADGSRGVGFIAHEVQEVSPGSVVGEKDGERMQSMEYGSAEFIANIIAELQSLRKRLADAGIA